MAADMLITLVRTYVEGVTGTINTQMGQISSGVTEPLNRIVQQVRNGAWKGEGADRFVEEMTKVVIPALDQLGTLSSDFGTLINKAMDTVSQAEAQASSLVSSLDDVFNTILSVF